MLVARRQAKREGMMLRVLVVCCVIGFVSCQIQLNSTINDDEINGTIVRVSELVTKSDIAVSEVELATASIQSVGLNPRSTEYIILNDRQCPSGSSKPCAVKCCPVGESIANNRRCEPSNLKFQVIFFGENEGSNATAAADGDYAYILGNPCRYDRYRLEPRCDSSDEFHVMRNGSLWAPNLFDHLLTPNDYCLEVFLDADMEEEEVLPLVCFPPSQTSSTPIKYILYPIGLLISVPFLLVTMLAYLLTPELRDLHGKTLICHILSLAFAYISLATVQLAGETLIQPLCSIFAFMIQFSFLACFLWLNALSFNIWWNVLANKNLQQYSRVSSENCYRGYMIYENNEVNMPKAVERKFFIYYSTYAWFFPFVIVVASMTFDLMPIIPSSYVKPNIGDNKCWFSSEGAELTYFYGPVIVSICINILLFMWTACMIYCHHRASRQKPRQIFCTCFLLFCVMGINWLMEIVSWSVGGPDYIWYVTDVINSLQGLIIFLLFVLEPRARSCVWRLWGPTLKPIVCCSRRRHASVPYYPPEDAAVKVNM